MNPILSCFTSLLIAPPIPTKKQTPKRSQIFLVFSAIVFPFVLGNDAFSQAVSTNSGAWSSASTWNTPPVNNGSVQIYNGATVTFGAGDSYTGAFNWFNGLGIGNGSTGTLNMTGGTLTTGAWYVGHQTNGTINLSGGTLNANGSEMRFGWTHRATMNITGGTLNMTGSGTYNIGYGAQSFINVTNGGTANFAGNINLVNNSQLNINGGTVTINSGNSGQQIVAQYGGSINQTAGTTTVGTNLWLGANGTTGTLNLSGGTWSQNNFLRLGFNSSGTGIINQSGGTFEMGSTFDAWGGSKSSYNLNGGTFRVTGTNVAINNSGSGMDFNITGSSGNVTMDTTTNNFTVLNTSTFNNAAATLTKTGTGKLTFSNASQLDIRNGALSMQAGTIETAGTLTIGSSSGTATATMTNGTLRTGYLGAGANFTVGNGGTGSLTQSGGTLDVGSQANTRIGWNAGGTGTYTLNGGTYSGVTNNLFIGHSGGTGTVNVNGGSLATYNLIVGGNSAASGTLNLNGGTVSLANADGFYVDANGTLNLNSGGSLPSANLRVVNGGILNFNGGTGNAAANIFTGGGTGGGTVDLNGRAIGNSTWGNLIASGSGAVLRNSSTNAATIASTGNTIWIWDGATNLTIDASGGNIQIDSRITSSGQATQTGIIKTGTNALVLAGGNDYTGATAINAGTLTLVNGSGLGSTAAGTTVASGAQLRLNATNSGFTVGNEALAISGQGVTTGGALRNAVGNNTYQGKITLAADATIGAASSTILTLDVASGNAIESANRNLTIDGAGTTLVNDGISLGTGGLTKIGSGTATLAAANNYSGATAVNAGLLKVLSGGSISSSSTTVNSGGTFDVGGTAGNVQVNSGGLLKGSGSVGAFTLASGGTLTPGNSPGTLTAASATILGGSTYNWEISALTGTAGTTWDLFSVGGLLNMSDVTSTNKWNLVVTGDSGFTGWTDTSSYTYVFAQAASVSGFSSTVGTDVTSLFNITTSGIASKPNASFNVNGDFKVVVGSANGFTTLNLMAVPEPSTGSMLGLGFAGLVVTRLLRRKIS
jgi:fibronectin-binding autotransporter adhesin